MSPVPLNYCCELRQTNGVPHCLSMTAVSVMDETHLSVFHSVSNRARGRRTRNSVSSRYVQLVFCFFSQTRDCTTFTLHYLTDFYVDSVTAHRIKETIIHVFTTAQNSKNDTKIKTSLRARGPPGVSGALRSLRILRIGRIGSDLVPICFW